MKLIWCVLLLSFSLLLENNFCSGHAINIQRQKRESSPARSSGSALFETENYSIFDVISSFADYFYDDEDDYDDDSDEDDKKFLICHNCTVLVHAVSANSSVSAVSVQGSGIPGQLEHGTQNLPSTSQVPPSQGHSSATTQSHDSQIIKPTKATTSQVTPRLTSVIDSQTVFQLSTKPATVTNEPTSQSIPQGEIQTNSGTTTEPNTQITSEVSSQTSSTTNSPPTSQLTTVTAPQTTSMLPSKPATIAPTSSSISEVESETTSGTISEPNSTPTTQLIVEGASQNTTTSQPSIKTTTQSTP